MFEVRLELPTVQELEERGLYEDRRRHVVLDHERFDGENEVLGRTR